MLPLKKCEEMKYIGACSYLLTKKEQRKMLKVRVRRYHCGHDHVNKRTVHRSSVSMCIDVQLYALYKLRDIHRL